MYELEIELAGVVPQADLGRFVRRSPATSLFQCLIYSPVERRAHAWQRAARSSGWEPVVCDRPEIAAEYAVRNRLLFSILDLEALPESTTPLARSLCESWVGQGGPLIVVCGNEEDPLEEIWARSLGVWLYLPGVDETCDRDSLCNEARALVAERQLLE